MVFQKFLFSSVSAGFAVSGLRCFREIVPVLKRESYFFLNLVLICRDLSRFSLNC